MTDLPFGRIFLPGPADIHPDVIAALDAPRISHRSPEMEQVIATMQPRLQRLFRTGRPVLIGTCSSTGFMEAAIRGGVRQRVLVVDGGYFGDRFMKIAEACGKEAIRVKVHPGRTIEPDQLAQFLDGPEVDAVALVHSETSTGALAPLEELARVVRTRPDVLLLVDAVTSLGASPVETDAWGIDFVFTGSQKALAVPPGLALGVASKPLVERARTLGDRGWYFDPLLFEDAAVHGRPTQTPAMPQYFALARQLERIDAEGGVEARWHRHYDMLLAVERWVAEHPGFSFFAPEGRRSWAVSALRVPEGVKATELVRRLKRRGWLIGAGLPDLTEVIIRIGHMGDVGEAHLTALLEQLEAVVAEGAGTPV